MIMWSIIPNEIIFQNATTPIQLTEIEYDGRLFQVENESSNTYRISRLISTDPNDFLNESYQPGTLIHYNLVNSSS